MFKRVGSLILGSLLLSACSGQQRLPAPANLQPENSIMGGQKVLESFLMAPYVAMIYGEKASGESYICTGTFISESTILTAKHCISQDVTKMSVIFGVTPLQDFQSVAIPVTSSVVFLGINKSDIKRNDIALIFFSGGLPREARIAKIYTNKNEDLKFRSFWALGYGRTEGLEDSKDSSENLGILREVRLHPSWQKDVFEVNQAQGKGVCFGDSGGPALVRNAMGVVFVIGVVSAVITNPSGKAVDSCGFKSLYMRADRYTEWIRREEALHKNRYEKNNNYLF